MSGGIQQSNIAVYAILRREDGRVAFVLRSNKSWMNHHYSLLAGRGEHNETVTKGVIREAKEEGGVDIEKLDLEHVLTMHRREKGETESWIDMFFVAKKWSGEPYNAEPEEHSLLDWLDPKSLPDNVIPMQAAALKAIEEGESYLEYGWL